MLLLSLYIKRSSRIGTNHVAPYCPNRQDDLVQGTTRLVVKKHVQETKFETRLSEKAKQNARNKQNAQVSLRSD